MRVVRRLGVWMLAAIAACFVYMEHWWESEGRKP